MQQAAVAGERFRFSEQIANEESLSPDATRARDLAIAELEFTLKEAQSARSELAAFGCTHVGTLELAIRVAAHFEAKGLRASIGQNKDDSRILVVAYEADREPDSHMQPAPVVASNGFMPV